MHLKTIIKSLLQKTSLYKPLRLIKNKTTTYFDKRRRVSGNHQFTVVSAVYNVEKYLDEYFESIVNQTLKFEDHIHLIMIDDGSPDNSANIIKKWQAKYPNNITYIKKENGGQASARNLGMEYVKDEWVTFIDPDDFLDYRYFEEVDSFLNKNKSKNFAFVACKIIFYDEKYKKIKDTQSLRYQFKENESIFPVSDLQSHIQMSASAAFFNTLLLEKHHNRFDVRIKPTFEDAHFINIFLIQMMVLEDEYFVGYTKKAKYYYRKRSDESSTLDGAWRGKERYNDQLYYGYLDLFKKADNLLGFIPIYIQRTILADLILYHRHIINHNERINFLNTDQINLFKDLLKEIFTYIDVDTIEDFSLMGCWHFHKVGLIEKYKDKKIQKIIYIEDYNRTRNEIKLRYFYTNDCNETILLNDKLTPPYTKKIKDHTFFSNIFVYEKIIWIPLEKNSLILNVSINNVLSIISFSGKHHKNGIQIVEIKKFFSSKLLSR